MFVSAYHILAHFFTIVLCFFREKLGGHGKIDLLLAIIFFACYDYPHFYIKELYSTEKHSLLYAFPIKTKDKNMQQRKEFCVLDKHLYQCISSEISTDKVFLTNKQMLHMADKHAEVFQEILSQIQNTITDPDYIIKDEKHVQTGLVVKQIASSSSMVEHTFIVLRLYTGIPKAGFGNSVISGWKISDKRLQGYLRNKTILYRKK